MYFVCRSVPESPNDLLQDVHSAEQNSRDIFFFFLIRSQDESQLEHVPHYRLLRKHVLILVSRCSTRKLTTDDHIIKEKVVSASLVCSLVASRKIT